MDCLCQSFSGCFGVQCLGHPLNRGIWLKIAFSAQKSPGDIVEEAPDFSPLAWPLSKGGVCRNMLGVPYSQTLHFSHGAVLGVSSAHSNECEPFLLKATSFLRHRSVSWSYLFGSAQKSTCACFLPLLLSFLERGWK